MAAVPHPVWHVPPRELAGHELPHKLGVLLLLDGLPDLGRQALHAGWGGAWLVGGEGGQSRAKEKCID